MLSAKGGVVMSIACLTLAFVAAVGAFSFGAMMMSVAQINRAPDMNDNREVLTDIEADILQRLKTAQFELRLIAKEDPNAPDLRSVIARLQEAVITLQLKR
jgi:hypothetical protein